MMNMHVHNRYHHTSPGTREVLFKDVSADFLQAVIKGIIATKQARKHLCHVKLLDDMNAKNVSELINFSLRLLMPWIGLCCAHYAVVYAEDISLVIALVTWEPAFLDAGDEQYWRDVVKAASAKIADNITRAAACPQFAQIPMHVLEKVVSAIDDCSQTGSDVFIKDTHTIPLVDNVGKSMPNAHGHYLTLRKTPQNELAIYVHMDQSASDRFFKIGKDRVSMAQAIVTVKPMNGYDIYGDLVEERRLYLEGATLGNCVSTGWSQAVDAYEIDFFVLGDYIAFEVCLESCIPVLEKKLMVMRALYACVNCIVLPGEHGGDVEVLSKQCMGEMWRSFRSSDHKLCAEACKELLCRSFVSCHYSNGAHFPFSFWPLLTLSDVEEIISDQELCTDGKEVYVLKSVIQWAAARCNRKFRLGLGQEVLVRPKCKHVE
jgi:hypothetical protein